MKNIRLNKKGFTLIELLAVIIILGILLLIAVPAVSKYIENSRKNTYINSIKSLVSAVSTSVNNLEYPLPKTGEGVIIPFEKVELEKGNINIKSPYATYVEGKSYVMVIYIDGSYRYYVATLDEAGYAIPLIDVNKLSTNSITADTSVISKNIYSIEEILATKDENGNYKTTDAFAYTYKSESGSTIKVDVMLGLSGAILRDNIAYADNVSSKYVTGANGIDFGAISGVENGKGLYYTSTNTENNLRTYYFRGDVKNNYVKFGKDNEGNDLYWRIIRINEDKSIRLIYQGTSATGNGQIGTSAFNEINTDNAYVGYMYGTPGSSTYELTHANTNNSTIKQVIDSWYIENLSSYVNYLADAGFCNDRSIATSAEVWHSTDTALGYGKNITFYGAYNRLHEYKGNYSPQFACPNSTNDLFTTATSSKGNKALKYPIGLITADEVAYAGGKNSEKNSSYYLHTGRYYWTMSPYHLSAAGSAYEWRVSNEGHLNGGGVQNFKSRGVRPVINLKSSVEIISGDGTSNNPYVIKTN